MRDLPARPPVNFVVYNQLPSDASAREQELKRLTDLEWRDGEYESMQHIWIWPVYCVTSHALGSARISDRLSASSINVVLAEALRTLKSYDPLKHFVVSVRADFRSFPYSDLEIVQNRTAIAENCIYMPHLPQVGLVKRSSGRREVKHVAYMGLPENLWSSEREIADLVKSLNLDFCVKDQSEWSDYSDVDICIGIRTLDRNRHNNKPPTKLINSWLAEVPFIGGNDSAFSQCGEDGVDYLRVTNGDELVQALKRLRDDPVLYQSIVSRGVEKAQTYTAEATGSRWLSLFETEIFPRYEEWSAGDEMARLSRYWKFARMVVSERTPLRILEKARFSISRR